MRRLSMLCAGISCLLGLSVQANSHVPQHTPHHLKRAKHSNPSSLTTAQRGNDFRSLAYANAYDSFGREIMKRDSDVKEVAESSRDSSHDFYAILKKKHISDTEARRRTARYYDAFVSMRRQFFSQAEAQQSYVDLKSSDEQTLASEDSDGLRLGP